LPLLIIFAVQTGIFSGHFQTVPSLYLAQYFSKTSIFIESHLMLQVNATEIDYSRAKSLPRSSLPSTMHESISLMANVFGRPMKIKYKVDTN
jgi:hypothetical protein